jgi:hypothetical protein
LRAQHADVAAAGFLRALGAKHALQNKANRIAGVGGLQGAVDMFPADAYQYAPEKLDAGRGEPSMLNNLGMRESSATYSSAADVVGRARC